MTNFVREFDLAGRPVIVLIGGAKGVNGKTWAAIENAVDRGLGPSASSTGAVVLTGGTHAGVMEVAGRLLSQRGITLVGVCPEAMVNSDFSTEPIWTENWIPDDPPKLDGNHDYIALTPGQSWGAETETLFELANMIRSGPGRRVVILVNGGEISKLETRRFQSGGWPVITVAGSGREADALALICAHSSSTDYLPRWLRSRQYRTALAGWGVAASESDSEIHRVVEQPELLKRRILWRLADGQPSLRTAWNTFNAFDIAANRAKRATKRIQSFIFAMSSLLVSVSLVLGVIALRHANENAAVHGLRLTVIFIPIALVIAQNAADSFVTPRTWIVLRQAAEATMSALYEYRVRVATKRWAAGILTTEDHGDKTPEAVLDLRLHKIETLVDESDISLALIPHALARPSALDASTDEFAPLTSNEYFNARLHRQLSYYAVVGAGVRRKLVATLVATTLLAAVSTALADSEGWAVSRSTSGFLGLRAVRPATSCPVARSVTLDEYRRR